MTSMGGTRLRLELDRIPLWRAEGGGEPRHVSLRQLAEDFGRYLYLPRLQSRHVLREAVETGVNLTSWNPETFAYAEGWEPEANRYRGLRVQQLVRVDLDGEGLLVKPDIAARQLKEDADRQRSAAGATPIEPGEVDSSRQIGGTPGQPPPVGEAPPPVLRRFHGSVQLDPARVGRDAGRVAEEVIQHLTTLPGSRVTVTLEVQAEAAAGVPDGTVRTVTENCRTLKFNASGFEET